MSRRPLKRFPRLFNDAEAIDFPSDIDQHFSTKLDRLYSGKLPLPPFFTRVNNSLN
jgi:hypothetical protein